MCVTGVVELIEVSVNGSNNWWDQSEVVVEDPGLEKQPDTKVVKQEEFPA